MLTSPQNQNKASLARAPKVMEVIGIDMVHTLCTVFTQWSIDSEVGQPPNVQEIPLQKLKIKFLNIFSYLSRNTYR